MGGIRKYTEQSFQLLVLKLRMITSVYSSTIYCKFRKNVLQSFIYVTTNHGDFITVLQRFHHRLYEKFIRLRNIWYFLTI